MNIIQKALAIREGGQVKRAHTMDYTGPYNVGMHSYNALSLLLLLYPGEPRLPLVKAILWHDLPERWTGDIPSPAKWCSPELKQLLDQLENRILEKLGLSTLFKDTTSEEHDWLNAVDLLELFMWGKDQEAIGNRTVIYLISRVMGLFEKKWDKIPKEVQDFIENYRWERTAECNELL